MKYFLKNQLVKFLNKWNLLLIPKFKYDDWKFRQKEHEKLDASYEEYDEALQYLNRGRADAFDQVLDYLKTFNNIKDEKDSIRNI